MNPPKKAKALYQPPKNNDMWAIEDYYVLGKVMPDCEHDFGNEYHVQTSPCCYDIVKKCSKCNWKINCGLVSDNWKIDFTNGHTCKCGYKAKHPSETNSPHCV